MVFITDQNCNSDRIMYVSTPWVDHALWTSACSFAITPVGVLNSRPVHDPLWMSIMSGIPGITPEALSCVASIFERYPPFGTWNRHLLRVGCWFQKSWKHFACSCISVIFKNRGNKKNIVLCYDFM